MATFLLINIVVVNGVKLLPGTIIDDGVTPTGPIVAAGGSLVATGDPTLDAAGLRARNAHVGRATNDDELTEIMQAALDTVQGVGAAVPTTRTITAGTGLTGGGDLSADRTINVVANADGSLVANANDVQVGVLATDAQHGLRGGGTQHANVVAAGAAGFMTGADKTKIDGLPASAVPTTRTLTAGAGMTGTGDLSADRTFDVVANADGSIAVNADDVQVGILATDAQHGSRGGGTQHADATIAVSGFMPAADKAKLDTLQFGTATLVAGVTVAIAANITANSRIVGFLKTPNTTTLTTEYAALDTDRVVGAPGSFKLTALVAAGTINVADISSLDWIVVN